MKEGFKRETEGETPTSNVDSLHDAGVFQLLCHEFVVKRVRTLHRVRLNASEHAAQNDYQGFPHSCLNSPQDWHDCFVARYDSLRNNTVLGECKPPPMPKFHQKRSGIWIQTAGLIQIQMSVKSHIKCCGFVALLASVISPSFVKTGRWLYEKCKIPYSATVRKMQKWSISGTGVPPKVNQFFQLVGPIIRSSFNKIGSLLFQ